MIHGTTSTGFEFTVDEKALEDDWKFIDDLEEMEKRPFLIARVVKRMIGKDLYKALEKHCTDSDGHVSSKKMKAEIEEIFSYNGENETVKNS